MHKDKLRVIITDGSNRNTTIIHEVISGVSTVKDFRATSRRGDVINILSMTRYCPWNRPVIEV